MTEYRVRKTGEIIADLKLAFPNVSLPLSLNKQDLDALGIDPVLEGPQPDTTMFQSVLKTGPEKDKKGNWVWIYKAVDWPAEQITSETDKQWDTIRKIRNDMLSASDWTQLADVGLSPEQKDSWIAYRQALRDITAQDNPFTIKWPVEPGTTNTKV